MNTTTQSSVGDTTAAEVQARPGFQIQYVYIRARNNGIPQLNGGYTLAVKKRMDGQFTVAMAQCPAAVAFTKRMGSAMAAKRLRQGKYLVVANLQILAELCETLAAKISTGQLVRTSLEHING